jgi:hypothetical protein
MVHTLALFVPPADRKRCRLASADTGRYMPDVPLQGLVVPDDAAEARALAEAVVLESHLPTTAVHLTTLTVRHMPIMLEYAAARRAWMDAELAWLARDTADTLGPFLGMAPYVAPPPAPPAAAPLPAAVSSVCVCVYVCVCTLEGRGDGTGQ